MDPLYIHVHVISVGRHRDLGIEDRLDELQGKIRELEKQNTTLKSKVRIQYYICMYMHVHYTMYGVDVFVYEHYKYMCYATHVCLCVWGGGVDEDVLVKDGAYTHSCTPSRTLFCGSSWRLKGRGTLTMTTYRAGSAQ